MFTWTCTMKCWRACREIVGKKTKSSPKFQNRWIYNFLNEIVFFIKNDSLAAENALLTPYQKILSINPQICSSDSENDEKYENLERKIFFLEMFLCTCRIQLWPPCQKFVVKILKTFCWNSKRYEKLMSFPKKPICQIFRLNMYNEIFMSLP